MRSFKVLMMTCLIMSCASQQKFISQGTEAPQPSDAYEWMETNPERLKAWLKQKEEASQEYFEKTNKEQLKASILARLSNDGKILDFTRTGKGIYYKVFEGPLNSPAIRFIANDFKQSLTVIQTSSVPNSDATMQISFFSPSPSGNYVVFGVTSKGSEKSTLHVFDQRHNKVLPSFAINTQLPNIEFLPDESGFFYVRHDGMKSGEPSKSFESNTVVLHKLQSEDFSKDAVIAAPDQSADVPFAKGEYFRLKIMGKAKKAILGVSKGTSSPYRFYVKDLRDLADVSKPWKVWIGDEQGIRIFLAGSEAFYAILDNGGRNNIIQEYRFTTHGVTQQKVEAPQNLEVMSLGQAKDALYLLGKSGLDWGFLRMDQRTHDMSFQKLEPGSRLETISTNAKSEGFTLELSSYRRPNTIYNFDVKKNQLQVIDALSLKLTSDYPELELIQENVKAKDGQSVPLWLIKAKSTQLDSHAPILMYAYAAYGTISTPGFDQNSVEWYRRGGVRTFCLARGGGELGLNWYRAGQRRQKPTSISDTVACAEHLIAKGWTNPKKLAFHSGSAGGIIAGHLIANHPELFAAVVSNVGVLNVSKHQKRATGSANVPEYGDINDPEDAVVMRNVDGYLNLKEVKDRPAVLITHGYNDSRVPIWMSAKFFGKLLETKQSSDVALMHTNFAAGHGLTVSTAEQKAEQWASLYSFLFKELNVP